MVNFYYRLSFMDIKTINGKKAILIFSGLIVLSFIIFAVGQYKQTIDIKGQEYSCRKGQTCPVGMSCFISSSENTGLCKPYLSPLFSK